MFKVELSSSAKKDFEAINDNRIENAIKTLEMDPVPAKLYDVKKLRGLKDTFRIRVGKVRIVYTILWEYRTIVISRISYRESAYD